MPAAPEAGLTRRPLASVGGLTVRLVRCSGAAVAWSAAEEAVGPAIVFVRGGSFVRREDGVESLLDGTVAYFQRPGSEEQFAHPAGHADECLAIDLPASVLGWVGLAAPELPGGALYTSAAVDLGHRGLAMAAAAGCDAFELYERVCGLVASVLEPAVGEVSAVRPSTRAGRRRLVARAREALLSDPSVGLVVLARAAGSSPHHLSRVFAGETGQTLSAYRNRLRVGLALARLEAGECDLSGLAAELGFADHAHMTRVTRELVGSPPSAVRRLLASSPLPPS
ncbi:MAG TPA: AraC family transcriptional regulator [Candidatus Dormibacteraeota bacterium]|nr:AraC family transcriptional regulator [Candidatus Dormibacteraeota bacterium]